jgi:metal-responsive CopG/Arc/MetJ family transcriptional regulator
MVRTGQALVQLPDEMIARLDTRAGQERRSRSELIREAVELYLHNDAEAEIDRAIVEGYTRHPPESLDAGWAARESIAAEPW